MLNLRVLRVLRGVLHRRIRLRRKNIFWVATSAAKWPLAPWRGDGAGKARVGDLREPKFI